MDYNRIENNYRTIQGLEEDIKRIYNVDMTKEKYNIDYNNMDKNKILEQQEEYISKLYTMIDILYQNKEKDYKKRVEAILESGNINQEFYKLYNMGRIIYKNKYIPISKIYIKVFRNKEDLSIVYQLISLDKKDFSIISKENVDINNYEYISFFKFKDSSIFKNLYIDKSICNIFDINIDTKENYEKFIGYLNSFDQKKYNFIKELSDGRYE